ncbi:GNAT family N-acetyltransferase [Brevibacterium otitidis]|uniref:GNAT family N-acetyltransferase n=1 Tax=Brevibacterium otitidis TaxID=53364 RepID=A0ABV5WZL0_9MICO|nr:GNAT family N-acetyltransferase [Brevibacterium otitidis]
MEDPVLVTKPVEVVDNLSRDRFELWLSGPSRTFVGFLGYTTREPGVYELQHTIIDEAFGRQGYARTLVTKVLQQLEEREEKIIPVCSYVQRYLERFPQFGSLVAEQ